MISLLNAFFNLDPRKLFGGKRVEPSVSKPALDAIAQSAPSFGSLNSKPAKPINGKRKEPNPQSILVSNASGIESLKRHKTGIPEFFKRDFFKRISESEQSTLTEKLEKLGSLSGAGLQAFVQGDWDHRIFKDPNWPLYAFRACAEGQLTEMQTSKLFLYETASKMKGFRAHDLASAESQEVLITSLISYTKADFQKLPTMKQEDTQFFSFRFPLQTEERAKAAINKESVNFLNFEIHFFKMPIHLILYANEIEAVIIPPTLWQEILKSKYGENAVVLQPVLGYSDEDRFHDTSRRILGIPSSLTSLPKKIHKVILTEYFGLFLHDSIHTILESANVHRNAWNSIVQNVDLNEDLLKVIDDRYFPLYARPDLHPSRAGRSLHHDFEIFWYSLASIKQEQFLDDFDVPENREKVLRHILSTPQFEEEGLSMDSLEICVRNEPEKCPNSLKPWFESAQKVQQSL